MTPQKLQDALRKDLEEEFQKYLFQNCKGEKVPINVFGQFLPKRNDKEYVKEDEKAEEDLSTLFPQEEMPEEYRGYYPFIQVILLEQISDLDSATQHISFFIGIHDDNCNNEGTREILNIIEVIRQRFFQNRTVGRSFFVTPNTKFIGLPEDNDTYPYFHGTVDMYFTFCPARKRRIVNMAAKKTAAQNSADTAVHSNEEKEEKTEAKQEEMKKEETKQEEKKKQKIVYVGPTIPGVIAKGVVLEGTIPTKLQELLNERGYMKNLLVELKDVAVANHEIARKSGAYYEFYKKAHENVKEVR